MYRFLTCVHVLFYENISSLAPVSMNVFINSSIDTWSNIVLFICWEQNRYRCIICMVVSLCICIEIYMHVHTYVPMYVDMSMRMYHQTSNISCFLAINVLITQMYSWSIACRRCSKYIFILDSRPGFNRLDKDNCNARRETFRFWDWVRLILDVLCYIFRTRGTEVAT